MEQGQQRQPTLGVSVAQISSGALASVTAAVVASYFGVGGTLIGAAITSVVATLGGALYKQSIERAQARVLIRRNPQTGVVTREVIPPAADQPRRRLHGGAIGVAIVLVFALALGSITAFEAVAKKPVAALLGRADADNGKTSFGVVMQEVSDPAPQAEPTAIPGVVESPTAAVGGAPTPAPTEIVLPGTAPTRTSVTRPAVAPTAPALPALTPSAAPTTAPRLPTVLPTTPAVPARPAGSPVVP